MLWHKQADYLAQVYTCYRNNKLCAAGKTMLWHKQADYLAQVYTCYRNNKLCATTQWCGIKGAGYLLQVDTCCKQQQKRWYEREQNTIFASVYMFLKLSISYQASQYVVACHATLSYNGC